MMIKRIINEDGTKFNPPKNPLEKKWSVLYPPIPKPDLSQVCDGYNCDFCDRCPQGSKWKVPQEDLEVWNQYRERYQAYIYLHNPSLVKKKGE